MQALSAWFGTRLPIRGLLLLALGLIPSPCTAAEAPAGLGHLIPPFNPALDAVHAPTGSGTGTV